jgi:hypothetical protein
MTNSRQGSIRSRFGTAVTRREQRWLRVLLEPNLYCGQCPYCPAGRYNLRERLRVVGCQPGVQVLTTQYVITPMRQMPAIGTLTAGCRGRTCLFRQLAPGPAGCVPVVRPVSETWFVKSGRG